MLDDVSVDSETYIPLYFILVLMGVKGVCVYMDRWFKKKLHFISHIRPSLDVVVFISIHMC